MLPFWELVVSKVSCTFGKWHRGIVLKLQFKFLNLSLFSKLVTKVEWMYGCVYGAEAGGSHVSERSSSSNFRDLEKEK